MKVISPCRLWLDLMSDGAIHVGGFDNPAFKEWLVENGLELTIKLERVSLGQALPMSQSDKPS